MGMMPLKGKTEQIFNAAIKVFTKKGLQATTLEIANEAEVAEVTLFRKFSTKQNLFITVMKYVLEKQFDSQLLKLAQEKDTANFLRNVIHNRLETLSKNEHLVKMLISESLMGNLAEDINLPNMIYNSLKKALGYHFNLLNQQVDIELCASQLGGIFLSQIIFPKEKSFHQLNVEEKQKLVGSYVDMMMALIS